jgi:hypothetical protein
MNNNLPLAWGACSGFARKYADDGTKGTEWVKFTTIVEDSATLDTTEGDKTEATIEGGDVEAVRYTKNKYALSFEERMGSKHSNKLSAVDGVVSGTYEFVLIPTENANAPGIYIPRANAAVSESYTAADGIKEKYTFDALKNDLGSKYGKVIFGIGTLTGGAPASFCSFDDPGTDLLG